MSEAAEQTDIYADIDVDTQYKYAKKRGYYMSHRFFRLDLEQDLAQDYMALFYDPDAMKDAIENGKINVKVADRIIRKRLIDKIRSKAYSYSWGNKVQIFSYDAIMASPHNGDQSSQSMQLRAIRVELLRESETQDPTDHIQAKSFLNMVLDVDEDKERATRIMERYFYDGKSEQFIADEEKISRSMVSRIINVALEKMRQAI